jgi:hypothetical protein
MKWERRRLFYKCRSITRSPFQPDVKKVGTKMARFQTETGDIVSFVKHGVKHDVNKTIEEYKNWFDNNAPDTMSRLAVRAAVQIVEAMTDRLAAVEAKLGISPPGAEDKLLPSRKKPAKKVVTRRKSS